MIRRFPDRSEAGAATDAPPGIRFRQAVEADLAECNRLWREAIDAYLGPMRFPPLPLENPGLRRLHAHTLSTDPRRFLVAERSGRRGDGRPGNGFASGSARAGARGGALAAFGSAIERDRVWFLSMLFVDPAEQGHGLGRALLRRLLPDDLDGRILATCTDSAQPISNGLYASMGIPPRMPLYNLVGRPLVGSVWPPLPQGVTPERVVEYAAWRADPEVTELDRSILGYDHPSDHAFVLDEPRAAFAYRSGDGRLLGYGYAGEVGRIGPIAVSTSELLAPVLGHLLDAVQPRGASSVWVAGAAGEATRAALDAGLRFDGFPVLACWSEPYADFTRYVPTSPGLI